MTQKEFIEIFKPIAQNYGLQMVPDDEYQEQRQIIAEDFLEGAIAAFDYLNDSKTSKKTIR